MTDPANSAETQPIPIIRPLEPSKNSRVDSEIGIEEMRRKDVEARQKMMEMARVKNTELGGFLLTEIKSPEEEGTLLLFAHNQNGATDYGLDSLKGQVKIHPYLGLALENNVGDWQAAMDEVRSKHGESLPYNVELVSDDDMPAWQRGIDSAIYQAKEKIKLEYKDKMERSERGVEIMQSVFGEPKAVISESSDLTPTPISSQAAA